MVVVLYLTNPDTKPRTFISLPQYKPQHVAFVCMQLSAKVNRVCDVYNNPQGKLRRNYVGPGLYSEPNEFTLPQTTCLQGSGGSSSNIQCAQGACKV